MAKQKRTIINDQLKVFILQYLADVGNIQETADTFQVAYNTVANLKKKNKELYESLAKDAQKRAIAAAEVFKRNLMPEVEEGLLLLMSAVKQRLRGSIGVGIDIEGMIERIRTDRDLTGGQKETMISKIANIIDVPIRDMTLLFDTLLNKHELIMGKPSEIKEVKTAPPEGVNRDEQNKLDELIQGDPELAKAATLFFRSATAERTDQGVPEEPSEG